MLFNSYELIFLFLPVVVVGFFGISRFSYLLAASWLAAASLFFYGWWNPKFVVLLVGSITFNYAMGYVIARTGSMWRGKMLFGLAIAVNLAVLGLFKYTNFFITTVDDLFGQKIPLMDVILPLGISFFTFTQIAFLVDVYRGIAREYNFVYYLLFVSYFPHLIAGPILHHKQIIPQFAIPETYKIQAQNISVGLTIFTIGLAKKTLLADSFGEYVGPVFDAARAGTEPKLAVAWAGAFAYTFQIYFDFSGYSDMAIGLSRLFGITLPLNFNSPYKALNIIEFWRRWHMTLSRFLRDYLYIPLGGNRRGKTRRYINVMVTMVLGGLWHGANWTFVFWGALHGMYLVINLAWHALRERLAWPAGSSLVPTRFFAWALTFLSVIIGWVFFRADGFPAAVAMIKGMFGFNGIYLPESISEYSDLINKFPPLKNASFVGVFADIVGMGSPFSFAFLLLLGAVVLFQKNTQELLAKYHFSPSQEPTASKGVWRPRFTHGLLIGMLFGLCVMRFSRFKSEFLYFQF